jgi:hypothetical protein
MRSFRAGGIRGAYARRTATVALLALIAGTAGCGGGPDVPLDPKAAGDQPFVDPMSYGSDMEDTYVGRAAAGNSHVLFAKSPGGVQATARRVERFRAAIEDAAGDVDADMLEAIVFLESAGRPDAVAGPDPEAAAGLTQIVAETGQSLLGMRIDLPASRRLTRRYYRELRRDHPRAARRALAARRRVDDRFVPATALAATVRYLEIARERLGRDDLAVVSYHMGIGNLEGVLRAYGAQDPSYAELYFGSTPLRHAAAWRLLSGFGDDSSTYYWRVLAAKEIMRLHREDPGELSRLAALHDRKASSEEVLHPQAQTEAFATPEEIADARREGDLRPLPGARSLGFARDRRMGELARRWRQPPSLYFALRPEAIAAASYIAAGVRRISGRPEPLVMTSAIRDQAYQRLLTGRNPEATHAYSLHTTGYAFDVLRRYRSRAQAVAFQFMLDRLQSLNLIAWVREPAAIHITVSSDVGALAE